MSDKNPACPVVETEQDAIDLGVALHDVLRHDKDWALRVLKGTGLTFQTGPQTLNSEMQAMWEDYTTLDERRRIIAIYMERRLSR